jgi:isoquinoline 1-oxidoreductase subunit alpha
VKWWTIAVKKRIEMSPSFATAQKARLAEDPARVALSLNINGRTYSVQAPDDMPLLWVLLDLLNLKGTKFGCGIAQCGSCTVHVDGRPVRSCMLPTANVGSREVTTIEAIAQKECGRRIQQACLELEVVQCGYCQSGQIMSAAALIERNPAPDDAEIDDELAAERDEVLPGLLELRAKAEKVLAATSAVGRAG